MLAVSLGTWQSKPNNVREAIAVALRDGWIQHIDTAPALEKVAEELDSIQSAGVSKQDICLVTKSRDQQWHTPVSEALYNFLEPLGNEHLDLHLVKDSHG